MSEVKQHSFAYTVSEDDLMLEVSDLRRRRIEMKKKGAASFFFAQVKIIMRKPHHEKTGCLPMRKQRRRSASQ